MKTLFTLLSLISTTAFAFQEGTYACSIDAFTKADVTIVSMQLTAGIEVPLVEYNYYKSGITHKVKGFAAVDIQANEKRDRVTGQLVVTTREVLTLSTVPQEIISFNSDGKVSENCAKK